MENKDTKKVISQYNNFHTSASIDAIDNAEGNFLMMLQLVIRFPFAVNKRVSYRSDAMLRSHLLGLHNEGENLESYNDESSVGLCFTLFSAICN